MKKGITQSKAPHVDHDTNMVFLDIETAPSLGWYYDKWKEGNIVATERAWYIMSIAKKSATDKDVTCYALPDFKGYKKDRMDDRALVAEIWKILDEADIVVAHNGDRFDIRKINARFIYHGFPPPSPYKTIDTLKVARKYFMFDSNRLNDVGSYLGVGNKLPHMGFKMWQDCMQGDMAAWNMMKKYNIQDVVLLEKVYYKERSWMTSHPNMNMVNSVEPMCPTCGSFDLHKRGFTMKRPRFLATGTTMRAQRFQCRSCAAWSAGKYEKFNVFAVKNPKKLAVR